MVLNLCGGGGIDPGAGGLICWDLGVRVMEFARSVIVSLCGEPDRPNSGFSGVRDLVILTGMGANPPTGNDVAATGTVGVGAATGTTGGGRTTGVGVGGLGAFLGDTFPLLVCFDGLLDAELPLVIGDTDGAAGELDGALTLGVCCAAAVFPTLSLIFGPDVSCACDFCGDWAR